jgi:hypothetical protein
MSVTLTEAAVVARTKTVTRRTGWRMLQPGDTLTLCRKVMGRRKGDPLVRLAEVEVVDVRRERLDAITPAEVTLEGVPLDEFDGQHPSPTEWVRWYAGKMKIDPAAEVTRIEWRYIEEAPRG